MHDYACGACRNGDGLDFEISMAFQPIVDAETGRAFAHEALVRGIMGEPAGVILSRVNDGNRYAFDQRCRVKALELAARLDLPGLLSINFLPNAVYRPETCIRATLEAARRFGFPTDRIIFEVTEGEQIVRRDHLVDIFRDYRSRGFLTAIDDFGAGYAGLGLLAEFQPDILKLDMALIRGVDGHRPRQAIVASVLGLSRELGIRVIAEGVETGEEFRYLRGQGVRYFQGYHFARPAFEALPELAAASFA